MNSCSPLKLLIDGSPPKRAREKSSSASWSTVTYFFRSPDLKTTDGPLTPKSFTSASARARLRDGSSVSTITWGEAALYRFRSSCVSGKSWLPSVMNTVTLTGAFSSFRTFTVLSESV